jgi:hypothetical protein
MDFVYPKGFLVKGIKSQSKTDKEAKNKDNDFLPFFLSEGGEIDFHEFTTLLQKNNGMDLDG